MVNEQTKIILAFALLLLLLGVVYSIYFGKVTIDPLLMFFVNEG